MNIPALINSIGWRDVLLNQHFGKCPEPVRMFYANMKPCFNTIPPSFTTIVFNYLITINVELLSLLLGIPIHGAEVMDASDFQSVRFNEIEALRLYTRDTGRYYPNMLASGRLPDDLKVLHYYITRVFLPRSYGHSTIHPTDMWILASAKENRLISYPHLMFGHMITYSEDNLNGALPFAPQITLLLRALGVYLRYKVSRVDLIDRLQAQFILRKVDASVGRRGPLVNAPGGDQVVNEVPDPEDGLSIADLVADLTQKKKDDGPSSSGIQKGLTDDEALEISSDDEDISDYIPSPPHPF
ncbi:unnamed protein product [Linum trigynum]|uniref:Uncharacterized protein n=1 Tax=Linum trigynum TaxID=586398 RepID=A0AAV2FA64_9ROSI